MCRLSLGIDVGTTSIKIVLFDPENNSIVREASRETEAYISSKDPWKNEQNVEAIFDAINGLMLTFNPEELSSVGSIGVSGQMHGVLLWGQNAWNWQNGAVKVNPYQVSNLVTWQDNRCTPEFLASLPQPNSHLKVHTGFGIPTIFWLQKNQPLFLHHFNHAGTIHDFVVAALINSPEKPFMSPQNAASWGYFNTTENSWNLDVLNRSHFPVNFLPEVRNGSAGFLHTCFHGVPAGCPIGIALGDLQASVYSILSNRPLKGSAVMNISTSAQLVTVMPGEFEPKEKDLEKPPGVEYFPYFDGQYLAVAAALTGGNTVATFVSTLAGWMQEFGVTLNKDSFWKIFLRAGLEQKTSDLSISPTLFGERSDPNKRASVGNINGGNISLGHISRALCQGIVTNLEELMPQEFLHQQGVSKIYGTGSALLRNEVLQEEITNIFQGIALELIGVGGDSAVGAAIYASKLNI